MRQVPSNKDSRPVVGSIVQLSEHNSKVAAKIPTEGERDRKKWSDLLYFALCEVCAKNKIEFEQIASVEFDYNFDSRAIMIVLPLK